MRRAIVLAMLFSLLIIRVQITEAQPRVYFEHSEVMAQRGGMAENILKIEDVEIARIENIRVSISRSGVPGWRELETTFETASVVRYSTYEVTSIPFTFRVPEDLDYADYTVCVTFDYQDWGTISKCFILHVVPYVKTTAQEASSMKEEATATRTITETVTTTQTIERTVTTTKTLEKTLTSTVTTTKTETVTTQAYGGLTTGSVLGLVVGIALASAIFILRSRSRKSAVEELS